LPVDNGSPSPLFSTHWCTSASEYWQMNGGNVKMRLHRKVKLVRIVNKRMNKWPHFTVKGIFYCGDCTHTSDCSCTRSCNFHYNERREIIGIILQRSSICTF
jgi:hypothetical protein